MDKNCIEGAADQGERAQAAANTAQALEECRDHTSGVAKAGGCTVGGKAGGGQEPLLVAQQR